MHEEAEINAYNRALYAKSDRFRRARINYSRRRRGCPLVGELEGGSPKGERSPHAKLSDAQIAQIRELAGTMPQTAIGRMFGISQPHVSDIINRRKRA